MSDFERNNNGRGYAKYHYTVQDIAEIVGKSPGAVRHDVSRGKLDMKDLRSVAEYIRGKG